MIGYIYCTVTADGCYYIGQHKKSQWDKHYHGSGSMLRGRTVVDCYQIDCADTISDLYDKEAYWIRMCAKKHKDKCINICSRDGLGNQLLYVNLTTKKAFTDVAYVGTLVGCSATSVSKWINRMDGGPRGLKGSPKRIGKVQKELMNNWVALTAREYICSKALHR